MKKDLGFNFPIKGLMIFLFSGAYLSLFIRILWRIGDEGLIVYGAQLVTEGALPYRDFFGVMGPLSFYWLALFFKLLGIKWIVARGLLLLTGAITAVLIYWMTRRLYSGPFDWLPSTFCTLMSMPLWPASSHHWDSNLFSLLSVATFFLWQDKKKSFWLVVTGVLAGLTSCFIQQKGLFLCLSFLAMVFVEGSIVGATKRELIKNNAIILGSYVVVGGLVVLFFFLKGGLRDLIYANLIFPISEYGEINNVPYGFGVFEFYWPTWLQNLQPFFSLTTSNVLRFLFLVPFLVLLAQPILIVILTALSCLNLLDRHKVFNLKTLPYWACGVALLVSEFHRKTIFNLIFGAPLLFIVLFWILYVFCERRKDIWQIGLALFSFCLIVFGIYNAILASNANYHFPTRRGFVLSFYEDSALSFLHEKVKPGESVFVYPYYSMYNFLANVKNPTRYNNLLYHYHTEAQFREAIEDLEQKEVKYVLWDTFVEGDNLVTWFPNYQNPPREKRFLEQYLERNYNVIDIKNGFRILKRQGS